MDRKVYQDTIYKGAALSRLGWDIASHGTLAMFGDNCYCFHSGEGVATGI